LRTDLPPLPSRLAQLPIDQRGFPVPWFVAWIDGKPDHRVMDGNKLGPALRFGKCWMCGEPLGARKSFCIGPMCCITRTIAEPPSHLECLQYAVRACPWMTRPHAKRREAGLPEDTSDPAGVMLKRNPGVSCLWTTRAFRVERIAQASGGVGAGVLVKLGEPERLEWFAFGRVASHDEVRASVESGLPLLEEQVRMDPDPVGARRELDRALEAFEGLMRNAFPSIDQTLAARVTS
jgi:hypothetical protein